jgi:hypothetical protein
MPIGGDVCICKAFALRSYADSLFRYLKMLIIIFILIRRYPKG